MPPGSRREAVSRRYNVLRFDPATAVLFFAALLAAFLMAGCAHNRAAAAPVPATPVPAAPAPVAPAPAAPSPVQPLSLGAYVEQGIASWYGDPFNGRRTSNGEVYDMNQPVAAHRTLPFGSMVRVTNLGNGLSTLVRIVDRGPFVEGRVIDLSRAAAGAINMLGAGTALVRLEVVSTPAPVPGYFAVQIGAFAGRENAERLRTQFQAQYPVSIQEASVPTGHVYRVRIGRESTQAAAQELAATLANQGFQAFVVRVDAIP